MKEPSRPLVPQPSSALTKWEEQVRPEFQELWFSLAKSDWRSVVFVPADTGGSAAEAATAFAQVGRQLHDYPVTLFVMANPADYWPALEIVNIAASSDAASPSPTPAPAGAMDYATAMQVVASASNGSRARPPSGRVIVSIQPVVAEPLGLAVTQAADLVVLCVDMGRTRMEELRRTVRLVGRDRIAGCLLDRSSAPPTTATPES